ncbi:hypothetical protein HMPREF9425_0524, partial [Streptococcus vestibularis ATCC 49124]
PLDHSNGLFVRQKSTESVPLFSSCIRTKLYFNSLYCFEWFQYFVITIFG